MQDTEFLKWLTEVEPYILDENWVQLTEFAADTLNAKIYNRWISIIRDDPSIISNMDICDAILSNIRPLNQKDWDFQVITSYFKIPESAFHSAKLSSVKFDGSIQTFEQAVFRSCEIGKVIIPDGTKYILDSAFCGSRINQLYLPKSLKNIRPNVFYNARIGCIYYGGTWSEFLALPGVVVAGKAPQFYLTNKQQLLVVCSDGSFVFTHVE